MSKPERKPSESLIEWLWRCEAARRQSAADTEHQSGAEAREAQLDESAARARLAADSPTLAEAWGRLGWETRPKAKEADRIRAHALGVSL